MVEDNLAATRRNLIDRATAERDAIGIIQRLHNAVIDETFERERRPTLWPIFCVKNSGIPITTLATVQARLVERMQTITTRRVNHFRQATETYFGAHLDGRADRNFSACSNSRPGE